MRPGEIPYLVDDDLDASDVPREKARVSDEVEATHTDWMSQLVRSVAQAGLARTATGPADPVSPKPSPSATR